MNSSKNTNMNAMNTEAADPRLAEIDQWPTEDAVRAMAEGQQAAVDVVVSQAGAIAAAAQAAAERLGETGRIGYAGAGTSGRVGVQDGVELTPTFGWPEERLVFLLAGGEAALMRAVEGAEDDAEAGRDAVRIAAFGASDVLIGIAASGRTPYTIGAIEQARAMGALTIGVSCNPGAALLEASEIPILIDTGSEAVAGSTRMKAGTAQKALLNLLSTAIMIRLGLVYRGLMVNMRISNAKLARRAVKMVAQIARTDEPHAEAALAEAEDDIRLASLIALGSTADEARAMLAADPRGFAAMIDTRQARTRRGT